MFQLYSKLAEYLQSGYAQKRNIPFQKEKTNHRLFPPPKKIRKEVKLRTLWKKHL